MEKIVQQARCYGQVFWFGFLSWLIPFIFSFFFFSKEGYLLIDEGLFKSIMVVVSVGFGSFLATLRLLAIKSDYVREGIIMGVSWFVINFALDLLILLPLSNMPFSVYVMTIAFRYFTIPIIAIAMGYLIEKKYK